MLQKQHMLTVQNEVFEAMEKGEVTALTLLDLSAAFNTIDYELLLNRLTDWFGIGGNALSWLNSYLRDRFQCININGTIANPFKLLFGVPQGSVLGPLLFIMYTNRLSSIQSKFSQSQSLSLCRMTLKYIIHSLHPIVTPI